MSLSISIRFLSGRAHLHPWQTHHSEGIVEWPPSHWRLLRALVAVAGRGLTSLPDFDDEPSKSELRASVRDIKSKKVRGVPKESRAQLSFSKAKQTLTLKEPLTLDEANAWKAANPEPSFVAAIDKLQELAAAQEPKALDDVAFDEIPLSRLAALLWALSTTPNIWLPRTSGGHTRQFFPIHDSGMVKNSGSAVFDTFAVVQKDQPLVFHWPACELGDEPFDDLKTLLQRMTYFGRAESWAQAEANQISPFDLPNVKPGETHWRCVCIEDGGAPEGEEYADYTLERRLAPLSSHESASYPDESSLQKEATRLLPQTKNSRTGRKQSELFADVLQSESQHSPQSLLLRCLLRESGNDMKDGLERPIGTRWVYYAVPRAVFDIPNHRVRRERPAGPPIQLVRFVLNSATTHRRVLPPLTDTLLLADKFRSALLAIHNSFFRGRFRPRNLLGREENGDVCKGHDHAYFWPTDEDNDGFLDHVTVYCPAGFGSDEISALQRLTRLAQRGGRPDLLVSPLFQGLANDCPVWNPSDANEGRRQTDLFVSASPYFCPLHLSHGRSKSGKLRPISKVIQNSLIRQSIVSHDSEIHSVQELVFDYSPDDLREVQTAIVDNNAREPVAPRQYFPPGEPASNFPPLLTSSDFHDARYPGVFVKDNVDDGFPFGSSVGLYVCEGARFIRSMAFVRRRRHHQVKGHGRMFVIRFRKPRIPHPFAIGAQCHYGLGLFMPRTESCHQLS